MWIVIFEKFNALNSLKNKENLLQVSIHKGKPFSEGRSEFKDVKMHFQSSNQ